MNAIGRARGHARRVVAAATGDHVRHRFAYQVDEWNIRYTLIPCNTDSIVGIIFGAPPRHQSEGSALIDTMSESRGHEAAPGRTRPPGRPRDPGVEKRNLDAAIDENLARGRPEGRWVGKGGVRA